MEKYVNDAEILEYLSRPENEPIKEFLLSAQRYHLQYGLEEIFPILPFLEQLKIWAKHLYTKSSVKGYYIVKSELTQAKFDDFEKFVFLDIFTSFLFLLKVDNFGFAEQSYSVEKLLNEKERVVKKILSYSKSDIKNFIDGFAGKLKNVQINQLNCYKRLYYRITKTNQHNVTDFTKILDLQINLLSKESGTLTNDVTPDTIDKLVNEQKVPESSENEKLFIKDVAAILKCHPSQVRRLILRKVNPLKPYRDSPRGKMYFFYPEIIDWMKSHKQLSYLEEAGEVFKRKPRGAVKKRRPLLE